MQARTEERPVECEVRVAAQPETVFAFFTDSAKIARWFGESADLDPRPGGQCRVDLGGGIVTSGEYVEITPYSRLVFTFGWEGNDGVPPGSSTVEVLFEPDGGGTVVRLRHHLLPGAEAREQHKGGWDHYMERLAIAASGGDPGPHQRPGA